MTSPAIASPAIVTPASLEQSPYVDEGTDRTSWAKRNPKKPIIPSRSSKSATDAEKATRLLRARNNQIKKEALAADLELFEDEYASKLKNVAEKHGRTIEYVTQLLRTSSHYKQQRAISLHNAIIYDKGLELNAGMYFLQKITLFPPLKSKNFRPRCR